MQTLNDIKCSLWKNVNVPSAANTQLCYKFIFKWLTGDHKQAETVLGALCNVYAQYFSPREEIMFRLAIIPAGSLMFASSIYYQHEPDVCLCITQNQPLKKTRPAGRDLPSRYYNQASLCQMPSLMTATNCKLLITDLSIIMLRTVDNRHDAAYYSLRKIMFRLR